jgi:hypothetical protein
LNWAVLAFFDFVALAGQAHLLVKKNEVDEESREDEEEIARIERHSAERPGIRPPTGITKALGSPWMRPLAIWVGGMARRDHR